MNSHDFAADQPITRTARFRLDPDVLLEHGQDMPEATVFERSADSHLVREEPDRGRAGIIDLAFHDHHRGIVRAQP
jgi:hypothetical protein